MRAPRDKSTKKYEANDDLKDTTKKKCIIKQTFIKTYKKNKIKFKIQNGPEFIHQTNTTAGILHDRACILDNNKTK